MSLDQLARSERQDFGVPPTNQLRGGPMHAPTPASIPGGQLITTQGVLELQSRGIPHLVVDVLGSGQTLPNAVNAAFASQAGAFDDRVQQQLAQLLQQHTGGSKETPLVIYCQGVECWMSYNAALRAIALGYRNVLWYRGGVEAWTAAGQRLTGGGFGGYRP